MARQRQRERIGQMRHRVTFRSFTTSQDSSGQETLTWSDHVTEWAQIIHSPASDEQELADRTTARVNITFRLRYRSDINEKMVINWNSKTWNIRNIIPDNWLMYMTIKAEYFLT